MSELNVVIRARAYTYLLVKVISWDSCAEAMMKEIVAKPRTIVLIILAGSKWDWGRVNLVSCFKACICALSSVADTLYQQGHTQS